MEEEIMVRTIFGFLLIAVLVVVVALILDIIGGIFRKPDRERGQIFIGDIYSDDI
jgi:hypothetical protein